VNGAFDVVIGIGLWVIGIPSAILWGILAFAPTSDRVEEDAGAGAAAKGRITAGSAERVGGAPLNKACDSPCARIR